MTERFRERPRASETQPAQGRLTTFLLAMLETVTREDLKSALARGASHVDSDAHSQKPPQAILPPSRRMRPKQPKGAGWRLNSGH